MSCCGVADRWEVRFAGLEALKRTGTLLVHRLRVAKYLNNEFASCVDLGIIDCVVLFAC